MMPVTDELAIIMKSVDQASRKIGDVNRALGEQEKKSRSLGDTWKSVNVSALAVAGAVTGIAAAMGKSINAVVDYAREVREMSAFTGLAVEDTSRLIQVADDWQISSDQLRSALQMAIKNGFSPTIDNLATLADEYANTADKTEFAKKAQELFGRGWTTLIPILQKGGDALRNQSDAVNENLIMTQESIDAAREYELALDDLTDSWEGFRNSLAISALPFVTDLLQELGELANAQTWSERWEVMKKYSGVFGEWKGGIEGATTAMERFDAQKMVTAFSEIGGAAEESAGKINAVGIALSEVKKQQIASQAVDAINKAFEEGKITSGEYDVMMKTVGEKFLGLPAKEINAQTSLAHLKRAFEEGRIGVQDYIKILEQLGLQWGKIPKFVETTYSIKYKQEFGAEPELPPGVNPPALPVEPYVPGPGTGPQSTAPTSGNTINSTSVTINAAPGMDEYALANYTAMVISQRSRRATLAGAGYIGQ